jgi:hypothetical protein
MKVVMLFILSVIDVDSKVLCLFAYPVQTEMQKLNFDGSQNKIIGSQYRKKYTIWELGKNKFT